MSIVALTVRQPWANLIASGKKMIETRRWRTVHRGPLLICSSVQPPIAPAGCAVAIVNLIDCRPMTAADEPLSSPDRNLALADDLRLLEGRRRATLPAWQPCYGSS
jgi:hypothetical protein